MVMFINISHNIGMPSIEKELDFEVFCWNLLWMWMRSCQPVVLDYFHRGSLLTASYFTFVQFFFSHAVSGVIFFTFDFALLLEMVLHLSGLGTLELGLPARLSLWFKW